MLRRRCAACVGRRVRVVPPVIMLAWLISGALDSDFEVVPSVRSVIVLDDFSPDVPADEPWEYLSDSDSDSSSSTSTSPPTYAQVLSSDS